MRMKRERRSASMGWTVVEDAGRGWRRVVPRPLPKEIVELETVRLLLEPVITVITVGGGGHPGGGSGDGDYAGTAAVIDKDFASSCWPAKSGPTCS